MSRYWRNKRAEEAKRNALLGTILPDIPGSVAIEIGAACNRKCPWCPQSGELRRKSAFLPIELFYKIVNELNAVDYAGSFAFHIYNEPLLDARIVDFTTYARAKLPKSTIYIHTNGDLLTLDLWRKLRQSGLTKIHVNQYDGKITDRIKNIVAQLSEEEKKVFGVFKFRQTQVCNRAGLVKTANKVPIAKRCRRMRQLCIDYRGNVVLCCNDYLAAVSVGNVKDKGVIELYNDPLMKHYRHELKHGRRAGLKLCDKCDL